MSAFEFFLSFCAYCSACRWPKSVVLPRFAHRRRLVIAAIILEIGLYALQLVSDTVFLIAAHSA